MKKYQLILILAVATIATLWIVGRLTKAIQFYRVPAVTNDPAIPPNTYILATNMASRTRLKFICYRYEDSLTGNSIRVNRLCGLPGDTVQIIHGELFVNGTDIDRNLNLKKTFATAARLIEKARFSEYEIRPLGYSDSVVVPLETIREQRLIKKSREYFGDSPQEEDPEIRSQFGKNWNAYEFGPFVVPAHTYFVLGDNRNFSQDSRYIGPIPENTIVGVVIGK